MAEKKEKVQSVGKIDLEKMRNIVNKKAGLNVAVNLEDEDPSKVLEWVSTGSTWLDNIIAQGQVGGIPVGRISMIAGASSSGKSFMAGIIAANAQKQGLDVVYFDTEATMDAEFMQKLGCDTNRILYIQPTNVEMIFETIEQLITMTDNKLFFIWDSYANTPTKLDIEGTFNPNETMALKPRIVAKACQKLTIPLSQKQATLLIINQLKTNLTADPKYAKYNEKYNAPGGMTLKYALSLSAWIFPTGNKESYILDENGYIVGYEMKVKLEKSKFGTTHRECFYKIMTSGQRLGVCDNESLFKALSDLSSSKFVRGGAWYTLKYDDGTEKKFQSKDWDELMTQPAFRQQVLKVAREELIDKFANKEGNANQFYNIENLPEPQIAGE